MVEAVAAPLDWLEALVYTPVTAAWALVQAAVLVLTTTMQTAEQAVRALARQQEPLAVQAARPALLALRELHLLLEVCLGRVAEVGAVVKLALAVQAVLAAEVLVVAAVVQPAVHMPLARAA